MVNYLFSRGKKFLLSEQKTVLSAATVIMAMTIAAQILGFIGKRVILHFFDKTQSSLLFASFRLPDLIFEVLVFGMFSSAFIPVFTRLIKRDQKEAWDAAASIINVSFVLWLVMTFVMGMWAEQIYGFIAPGYSSDQIKIIGDLARILFFAQGFFVMSYVLTGVLESLKRFLVPALAPVFYNLGVVAGTIILTPHVGILAPAYGAVIGAFVHFAIQLPLAIRLGFRFKLLFKLNDGVKSIIKLATPRFIDLSFQQILSTFELYFASLISTASYTFFTLANSLQVAPVRLFGASLAKAALPTLSTQDENIDEFKRTLFSTLYQIFFLVLPFVAIFTALRIPTIRIFFGTDLFDWEATVQTALVLSAFAIGIPFQTAVGLLARAFYAIHDTKTPVFVSLVGDSLIILGDFILVRNFGLPTWGLALSFSFGAFIETLILLRMLKVRIPEIKIFPSIKPLFKSIFASIVSGSVMYLLLKTLDRSVWAGRGIIPVPFERFVLDTRYTVNLMVLTAVVAAIGMVLYLLISWILKSNELMAVISIIKDRRFGLGLRKKEPITSVPTETGTNIS